ncbi:MFS transporter [archaeon]|nr:MFS transporter [archaeon]
MNKIIKFLILADILLFTGFGLISPIMAIFIKENLAGGTVFAAGLASTIYFIVKSAVELPFSKYVDVYHKRIRFCLLGTLIMAVVPLFYILASDVWHIYIIQALYGIGSGIAYPTWMSLFSTNLDKGKEAFEWSVYSVLVGLGIGIAAAVGGGLAEMFGFNTTFLLVSLFTFVSGGGLLWLELSAGTWSKERAGNELKCYGEYCFLKEMGL